MSRCLYYHKPCIRVAVRRADMPLDLQWKLSTLFETIEVKFTTGEGMLHVLLRMLFANVDLMPYSAWVVTAP